MNQEKRQEERLFKIILAPYMSEKAAIGTEKRRQYVFKVTKDANKIEIKKAIEALFKTVVSNVNTVNVKSKPKRFGQVEGKSKSWKKAYVTLQQGHEINFAGGQ